MYPKNICSNKWASYLKKQGVEGTILIYDSLKNFSIFLFFFLDGQFSRDTIKKQLSAGSAVHKGGGGSMECLTQQKLNPKILTI